MSDVAALLTARPNDVTSWETLFRALPADLDSDVPSGASVFFVERDWWRFSRRRGLAPTRSHSRGAGGLGSAPSH